MAIKGIGYDDAAYRNTTVASGDTLSVDGDITVAEGLTATTGGVTATAGGVTATAGGITAVAGGLDIQAGGASIVGNSSITGNLTVSGTLISQDEEQVLVKDNFLDLNFGYVGTSYEQTGLTFNYQATNSGVLINTTTNNLTFTAGTSTDRAKVVASTASGIPSGTFTDGDIVQISGTTNSDNDGIYVVDTNTSAGTVEFKSDTLTSPDTVNAKFALLDVTSETESTSTAVTIRKVNLMALRSSNAGVLQSATGSADSDFATYSDVGAANTLQEAYDAPSGNTITTDASGPISFTLSQDAQGFSVQGSSGGNGIVSIGGTTAVDSFVVGASGAASSITSTGQNLTLQTATSGQVVLRSAGLMTVDSDDAMTIQMDANDGSNKALTIQANNANIAGEGNIVLDADDNVDTQIAGTRIWGVDSGGAAVYGGNQLAISNTANTVQYIILDGSDGSISFDQADGVANVISKAAAATDDDLQIKVTGNQDAHLLISSEGTSANALKLETVTNSGGIELNSAADILLDAASNHTLQIASTTVLAIDSSTIVASELVQLDDSATKGLRFGTSGDGATRVDAIYDQDDMSADDENGLATQQSIKAYVDNTVVAYQQITTLTDGSSGALSAGDVVAINASGQAIQADANAEATCRVLGVCVNVDGSDISVAQVGNITGLSGLTAGQKLYASGTAGGLTATPPSSSGDIVYLVGYATSTSAMVLAPQFIMEIG